MNDLLRRKLLMDWYASLSEKDREALMAASLRSNHEEVMNALRVIDDKADKNHHPFFSDLLANVAGNGIYDASLWLLRSMLNITK